MIDVPFSLPLTVSNIRNSHYAIACSLLISRLHHLDTKYIGNRFAFQILNDGVPPFL